MNEVGGGKYIAAYSHKHKAPGHPGGMPFFYAFSYLREGAEGKTSRPQHSEKVKQPGHPCLTPP